LGTDVLNKDRFQVGVVSRLNPEGCLPTRSPQEVSRHISVSSFDGVVTEVGTVVGHGIGEMHFIRCHKAPQTVSGLLDTGALNDPMLCSGFRYQDGQWSFVMRKRSQMKD
jgi:hypothetical protein